MRRLWLWVQAALFGTHHYPCGGRWDYQRATVWGHYERCNKCGAEVYETDC